MRQKHEALLKKMNDSKVIISHLMLINILLVIFGVAFYIGYAVFSMLAFGEGANSFMYSKFNDLIFYIGMYILPFLWIIFKIRFYVIRKTDLRKAKDYCITIITYSVMFLLFVIYMHMM